MNNSTNKKKEIDYFSLEIPPKNILSLNQPKKYSNCISKCYTFFNKINIFKYCILKKNHRKKITGLHEEYNQEKKILIKFYEKKNEEYIQQINRLNSFYKKKILELKVTHNIEKDKLEKKYDELFLQLEETTSTIEFLKSKF